ncbi:LysR family transcriptional regulator [Proteiniclasticum ruminis]|uniref:DNA-binding transcriptional regulator, LysR family n=1 Tax=Proteiniclasticum ruminis TaxID=398199 RepID=A0A1G8HKD7_9CLOT|nr:LysR family transcriptional regulator [Proteiniclasticum ruminis]SDI07065.1 DNA-binding transcriptional regulator, LysR family [Proteiniclasticum ruminis]
MLDPRLLTFIAIVEEESYTKAAARLSMTQPGLSHQMKQLEEMYDVKLFHYENRRISLTEEGMVFRKYAEFLLYQEKMMKKELENLKKKRKKYYIGATMTLGEYTLAPHLKLFYDTFKEEEFSLMVDNTKVLLSHLQAGHLDFALIEGIVDKALYQVTLLKEVPFILVVGQEHRLSGRKEVSMEELLPETLLVREEGSGSRKVLETGLSTINFSIRGFERVIDIGNIGLLKKLTEQGAGISFMYKDAVLSELSSGTLKEISVKNLWMVREFNFVTQPGNLQNKEFQRFYSFLKSVLS